MIFGEIAIEPAKRFRVGSEFHQPMNFALARPDVTEPDRLIILAETQRFGHQILEHGTRDRVRHHQRWRSEKVGADVGVNSCLEVAIAREYRGTHQIIGHHSFFDGLRQWSRVANTGCATIAHKVEAHFIKVCLKP